MNKKLMYLFAVLVVGLFVISSCQQDAVGARVNNKKIENSKITDFGQGGAEVTCSCGIGTGNCKVSSYKKDVFENGVKVGETQVSTCVNGDPACEGSCDGKAREFS